MDTKLDKILILDFGSQYTQLIARRVREASVYSEIYSWDAEPSQIIEFKPNGIILSGGPESAFAEGSPKAPQEIFEMGIPILGICYGMQTMTEQLDGGTVLSSTHREFGYAQINFDPKSQPLFEGIDERRSFARCVDESWRSSGRRFTAMALLLLANSENSPLAAISNHREKLLWIAVSSLRSPTQKMGKPSWRILYTRYVDAGQLGILAISLRETSKRSGEEVGDDHVLLGLSGGVDSSVVAALLNKAIGDQLTCIFVDNGLLRLDEGDQVMDTFAKHLNVRVIRVDAEEIFLGKLEGITDPEEKRKIIGNTFIEVFEDEANKIENVKWLAQGTIYPDVIESAGSKTGKAHVIKSHHNVGGLPDHMTLKLIEPLRDLFKDEVRTIGKELGLSDLLVNRHPFPGPGLGVRILGEVNKEYADLLRLADNIFIDELLKHDLYYQVSQAFAVFLPSKISRCNGRWQEI